MSCNSNRLDSDLSIRKGYDIPYHKSLERGYAYRNDGGDQRFKVVGPDSLVMLYNLTALQSVVTKSTPVEEPKIWFDWRFVDFWKSNYYTIQRGFSDPQVCV